MKKMNENQLRNHEGGRFWGWTCSESYPLEAGSCYRTCSYQVAWITQHSMTDVFSCSNLPGSNPNLL